MPFLRPKNTVGYSRTREIENTTLKNGLRTTIHNPNGSTYRGFWKNNQKEGSGVILTSGIQAYFGAFYTNTRNGYGLLVEKLEDCNVYRLIYKGDWKGGYRHGFGSCDFRKGNYYIGEWRWGKRHGYGKMWYSDGSFFDGEWAKDKRNGLGMLVRADGSRYEGYFVNNSREGKGKFYYLDSGQMQEGIWKDDMCVYSTIIDLPYRSACLEPTFYPIIQTQLSEEATRKFQSKAEIDATESCLMSSSTEVSSRLGSYFQD